MRPLLRALETLGAIAVYLFAIVRSLFTGPRYVGETLRVSEILIRRCLIPVGLAVAPVGAVIALQGVHIFRSFGAEELLSSLLATAVFREYSPALASVMVAAQAGSSIAARIGTMRVRGQIDALAVMSVDPIRYVVLPGLIACAVVTPLLNVLTTLLGLFSGWVFAVVLVGCDHGSFMANLYSQVSLVDLYVGLSKCLVFGTAVGLIAGYLGLQTTGGAAGVGKAANNTVTYTIVLILVCDYLASMLLLSLGL
ncbi:ABC transporter permease [Nannocystis sp.]|uniref:MlaE family ABC transporter permease n=1 Tax=Nannocystis sp. TaxID=1962667 RepID=UPI0025CE6BF3|nr:ABC transporter permease [Nannocystis sp.]MBK7829301.1 ABC transporter permease [Nannocystis sp.]